MVPALEGVFRGENVGSAGERMEQEVLLVEEIVDAEVEGEVLGRTIVNLHVDHEIVVEGAEYMRDNVGIIQRRILLAAVARRDRVGPAVVRT